jgi:glutamate synthase domain-containing protein 2
MDWWHVLPIAGAGAALLTLLAVQDMLQTRHAVRRVYPIVGRLRYLVEQFGPELRQYIVTNDLEERPFNRAQRSWVYQTAKHENSAVGFGTQRDLERPGEHHFLPSPFPTLDDEAPQDMHPHVLGPHRPRPYETRSRVHVAPMSFGALSASAVRALSYGAVEAGSWLNTGEGGISTYHLEGGADLVFQFGPAKYGVRTPEGELDWHRLHLWGAHEQVRAIEVKVGQGAKPGKGGILPAAKVTEEIAAIRLIEPGKPSYSPNRFSEFSTVDELVDFIERTKAETPVPVGIKITLGAPEFVDRLARIFADSGRGPDYVSIDGAEGGTGAAPLSLADRVGVPLHDAIVTVDDAYRRHGVRERITLVAAGRMITGADVAYSLALGADLANIGRGFLFSLGCIQALRCHTNECPTGVATQSRWRQRGLVPEQKRTRVAAYARAVQDDLMVVTRSLGLTSPGELRREHVEVVVEIGRRLRGHELYPYPKALDAPYMLAV